MSEGVPTMSISFNDVEKLQALYPDHQIELREGKIIIMSPSDGTSAEIGMIFGSLLSAWVYNHNSGRVLDSSSGFRMPNGDLLSPDIRRALHYLGEITGEITNEEQLSWIFGKFCIGK